MNILMTLLTQSYVPEQDHDEYSSILRGAYESRFGGPGSTVNFWQLSAHSERLTLKVKMHSTTAFLSMPNADGVILGGRTNRDSMITP